MLARLQTVAGVRSAAIDHSGELLRLELSERDALDAVRDALTELGYAAEELSGNEVDAGLRWHDRGGVHELSSEEARVIARRVVPPFVRAHELDPAVARGLPDVVADALYACFIEHPVTRSRSAAALHDACSRAVARATRGLVGDELARALGDALWDDAPRV